MQLEYVLNSSMEVRKDSRDTVAVIPVGSIEQHCQGPLGTDAIIAEALAREGCRRASGVKCTVLPAIYYGYSPEWGRVPGTITLSLATFTGLITDILDSLYRTGFRRIAILNGHGGNAGMLESIAREWVLGKDAIVAVINYWRLIGADLGHASKSEELVARLLGINIDFGECIESREALDPVMIRNPPIEPVKLESRQVPISREELIGGIVDILTRLARQL